MSIDFYKRLHELSRSSPLHPFNIGIPSALNRRPMYNLYARFVGDKAIESRSTLIRGKGDVSTY